MTTSSSQSVLLLLAEGFEFFEASVFIDVIGWNQIEGDGSTALYTCGPAKIIDSSFGQKILVDYLIDEVNPDQFAALAIPGGFEEFGFYRSAYSENYLSLIRKFHHQQKPIASICTGALPLAKAGILRGRKATTYRLNPQRQKQLSGMGATVIDEPIVADADIITSWNPSTAADVAFLLLERLTSRKQMLHVRTLMGFTP